MDQQLLNDESIENADSTWVDLGAVSEETKGGLYGWPDGGGGHCYC